MLLPCPHCKKHFKLNVEQLPEKTAKLKCPACNGVFALQPSATYNEATDPTDQPSRPPLPSNKTAEKTSDKAHQDTNKDQTSTSPLHTQPKSNKEPSNTRRTIPAFWFLVPVALLLISLIGAVGILMPAPGPLSKINKQPSLQEKEEEKHSPSVHTQDKSLKPKRNKSQKANIEQTGQKLGDNNSLYQLLWSFTSIEMQESCKKLTQLQTKLLQEKKPDPCRIYPLWIAYLSLETSPVPACKLDPVFAIATEAIQKKEICGPGYAFLSAYYTHKRIMDRSESFLKEALHHSKNGPWVKIVEAVFYQRIYQDQEKALTLLQNLFKQHPEFPLVWHLMARIYIETEEYEEANSMLQLLKKKFPQQKAFFQIQQALSSIHKASYYSREKAEGLLEISKAFASLKNYRLAEHLSQKVLKEMKSMLPKEQQKLAFYELGRIYEMKRDKDRAYDSYLKALRIDPHFKAARERIGHLLKKRAETS